jgi:NADH-quinone oxidoreductase subunit C
MNIAEIADRLKQQFGEQVKRDDLECADPWIEIEAEGLHAICRFLRETPDLRFDYLHCISGIDYMEPDPKKAKKIDWEPHFELLYHLSSMQHRHRLVLRVVLPRWRDDEAGRLPEVASVADIWRTADWHEREVYDLCGVSFAGHPDFRRILCPEDWEGHPLRKDYETPDEYHGIRVK